MPTALISSGPLRGQPGRFREILHEAGFETIDPPGVHQLSVDELRQWLPRVEAVVAGAEPYRHETFALCPRLRIIARTGVGYDAVDVEAASRHGVAVTITPGTNHESVAEQAFGLILAVLRRVALNDRIIREGRWDRTLVEPVRGKVLGLVGLGRIGRAMVPKARAFGMEVVAFDVTEPTDADSELAIRRVTFDELLAGADIVSLHLPLLPATKGLFNREVFARMKPGSYLINTARGGVLVESDLYDALTTGHLAGAGLDVLEVEPPAPDHPLLSLPNVAVSPHIGGIDKRAMADMAELAARCIVDCAAGDCWPEPCVVNPQVRSSWRW